MEALILIVVPLDCALFLHLATNEQLCSWLGGFGIRWRDATPPNGCLLAAGDSTLFKYRQQLL